MSWRASELMIIMRSEWQYAIGLVDMISSDLVFVCVFEWPHAIELIRSSSDTRSHSWLLRAPSEVIMDMIVPISPTWNADQSITWSMHQAIQKKLSMKSIFDSQNYSNSAYTREGVNLINFIIFKPILCKRYSRTIFYRCRSHMSVWNSIHSRCCDQGSYQVGKLSSMSSCIQQVSCNRQGI